MDNIMIARDFIHVKINTDYTYTLEKKGEG